jgi:hypothetical protein
MIKRICVETQTFEYLIENNCLYIDKTEKIYKLITDNKIVFLSRPRRFGKSLLISTLEDIFLGKKELFKGLYIYDKWKEWDKSYPVIHLDLSKPFNENNTEFIESLNYYIDRIAKSFNISLDAKFPNDKLTELIDEVYNNYGEVVILVDEYDAPILDNITDTDLAEANRKILQSFYLGLKNSEKYAKFIFVTGISKFAHTSIFSKFNNPRDITLLEDFSTICGITHNELKKYCSEYIQKLANTEEISYNHALDEINKWYDGYSFDGKSKVFNPFSTLTTLKNKTFNQYWFSTGTPHFLVDILKNKQISLDFNNMIIEEEDLNEINPLNMENLPLLFQGAYLTIDKKLKNKNMKNSYLLKIPNFEVEQAYENNLKELYVGEFKDKYTNIRTKLWKDINNGKCNSLAYRLQSDISNISPFLNRDDGDNWKNYEIIFLTWMNVMGFSIQGEKAIKHGRMDGVFEDFDNDHVVIVEIKYTEDQSIKIDDLINKASKQIHKKEYWLPYEGRKVSLLALAFKDEKIDNNTIITRVRCKIEDFDWNQVNDKDY